MVTSATTTTGLTNSTALPRTQNIYDAHTGLQTEVRTLNADNTVKATVTTGYDSWGRTTSYTDEHGKTSSTTYDAAGRVATETSPENITTTYTYDPYTGSVTKKNISGIGDFTATYDRDGNITSQTLPTGVTQSSTYDRTGQETSLAYTITGDQGNADYAWTMGHDAFGRIFTITGPSATNGVRTSIYEFDQVARMTQASDRIDDTCTTRAYTFDTVGRRTALTTTTQTCDDDTTTTSSSKTWDYDKADRLLSGANGTGTYTYDPLGRQLSLPSIDTPQGIDAGNLTIGYYDNDLARSVTQNGVTTTYDIDVMERRSTSTTTGGTSTSTTQRYYEDTSDKPAWATTTTGNTTETTRYLSSIAGDMSVTKNMDTGFLSAGIIDPQGSVVTTSYAQTLPADTETGTPSQTVTAWSALEAFDEYGNTLNNVAEKLTGAIKYAWLDGKERATDTTGLVLMGVRLYSAITGHFTSVDPVVGGNTTRYSYPQDPINKYDLDGKKARPDDNKPQSWYSKMRFKNRNFPKKSFPVHVVMRDGYPGIHWGRNGGHEKRIEFGGAKKQKGPRQKWHFNNGDKHESVRQGFKTLGRDARTGIKQGVRAGSSKIRSGIGFGGSSLRNFFR